MGRLRRLIDPGERAVRFINNLTLSDDFRGQPFRLRPWQAEVPRKLFGTLRPDGLRQYRRCLLFLGRKQAKTQLSAGMGLFPILGADLEGQTVLLAASDRNQASHLFDKSAEMISADPYLDKRCNIYESKKTIVTRKGNNKLKVISADGRRQLGENPSVVIMDELLSQPNRKLHDALATSFGTRKEPLMILISTAGNERGTLIHDEYLYACKVRDGIVDDPTYLPIIYEATPEMDWTDEATWLKAMPALGDFCNLDFIRSKLERAKQDPSEESAFKQFFLNLWVAAATKWLNREAWSTCGEFPVDLESLKGRECFGGLDLSNRSDMTAFVLVFPFPDDVFKVLPYFWIPEKYAAKRDKTSGSTKYLEWARKGFVTLTDGDVIDYDLIKTKVLEANKLFRIKKTNADPWNATQICLQLQAKGMKVEMMRQGSQSMNEPVRYMGVALAKGQLHHGSNEAMNWQADNAVTVRDSYGNIRFDKESSAEKIDGLVSLTMAIAGAILEKPKPKASAVWI
jgi:phage terminase large subunit-like protein